MHPPHFHPAFSAPEPSRVLRWVAVALALHIALFLTLSSVRSRAMRLDSTATITLVELSLESPPRAPSPAPTAPLKVHTSTESPVQHTPTNTLATPVPVRDRVRSVNTTPSHRGDNRTGNVAPQASSIGTGNAGSETSSTPTSTAPPDSNSTHTTSSTSFSAAEILRSVNAMSTETAVQAGVNLGRTGAAPGSSRVLFPGTPSYGSALAQASAAINAPLRQALEPTQHSQAAGTAQHDAWVARRAGEVLSPARRIANLNTFLERAPLVNTPGGNGSMVEAPYHKISVEVEVDQNSAGEILEIRPVRRSGVAQFDSLAIESLRETLADASTLEMPNGRRSRWLFEISNAFPETVVGQFVGATNEGWTVLRGTSNGMLIRYRVRRTQSRPLTTPSQSTTPPRQTTPPSNS